MLDGLSVGAYPLDAEDVGMLEWMGIERILNLVADEEYEDGQYEDVAAALAHAGIEECRFTLTDYGGLPVDELEDAVQEVIDWLHDGARTYIHCRAGWQRSAAVAAGVVALHEGLDIDRALAHVQARKPSAVPLPHQRDDLRRWWEAHHADEVR